MTGPSGRLQWLLFLAVMLVLITGAIDSRWLPTSVAFAQDDPAAKPDKKDAPAHSEVKKENFGWWVVKTSGPIGLVLFGLSVYFIALTSKY